MTVDELVVKLALDPSALKQGAKEATAATKQLSKDLVDSADKGEKAQTGSLALIIKGWSAMSAIQRKTADESVKHSKAMSSATEGVAQSGEKALRTFGALFLLFAGGNSIKSFITDMLNLDAATGRAAANIGQTPEALSGIGRAVERLGGTFGGAVGGLRGLSDAFEQMRTTGNSAINEPLARLQGLSGQAIKFGKDVHENFLSIAEALKAENARDPAMADYLGRQILGDEGLTNLAKKGRAGVLAEEAKSPKISKDQADQAQKLQAQLAAVRQGFQDIGNSILMDFGPAMISAAKYVKDLLDQYRPLIETKVSEWVKDIGHWFETHKSDVEAFGTALGTLATAAANLAIAFTSQSPMMMALEAFAATMGGSVLGALSSVRLAMLALGAVPAPAWALAALGLSADAAWQASKRTAADMSDPNTVNDPSVGVDPETGLTFHVAKPKPQSDAPQSESSSGGGVWNWIKKLYGFGGDPKTRENLDDIAKATGETRDLMKAQKDGIGTDATGGGGAMAGARRALGWAATASGDHTHVSRNGKVGDLSKNPNATPENAKVIRAAAKELGTTPEDLATVIGYETGGSFSPSKWGGKGGNYMGLIQFGPSERAQYGANDKQTFPEQMGAVVRYLKGRGYKPGMGLMDLYSTINAGSPGHYGASDGNGTVASHVTRMQAGMATTARAFLAKGDPEPTAMAPTPAGTSAKAIGDAEVAAARQRVINGSRNPADREIVTRYLQEQNTPKPPLPSFQTKGSDGQPIMTVDRRDPRFAPHVLDPAHQKLADAMNAKTAVTFDHVARHLMTIMRHAHRLTRHDGDKPVRVLPVGHDGSPLAGAASTGRAHAHAAAINNMLHIASAGRHAAASYSRSVSNTSDTQINGGIHVHTAATDARGIAADIEPHLHRGQAAGRADYGLA